MISLIITNYKTWSLCQKCIESAMATDLTGLVNEIVIVDDFSQEPVPSYFASVPHLSIIKNKANFGYARSVNIGAKAASNEICLLLDSDAFLLRGLELIPQRFQEEQRLGLLGFRLVDAHGCPTGSREPEPDYLSLLLGQKLHSKFFITQAKEKITIFSCAMAFRKSVFNHVDGFDENFDFTDADIDFSMKVNRSSNIIGVEEKIILQHEGGGSPQLTSKRVVRFYKNRLLLLKKHNLLPIPIVLKLAIIFRSACEFLFLSLCGWFMFASPQLKDKLKSRAMIITNVFTY